MNHREALGQVCSELGEDEIRTLLFLAHRLAAGQRAYGLLDLATDTRDWKREQAEEAADLLIYAAFDALKNGAKP